MRMLSVSYVAALALAAFSPAQAKAEEPLSFTYDGQTYTYKVSQLGDSHVVKGSIAPSQSDFTLYIAGDKVHGYVDGTYVKFSTAEITNKLAAEKTTTLSMR
ncbi:MAG: hypothetical protein U1E68_07035 [Sphingomonadaceae bacterium]